MFEFSGTIMVKYFPFVRGGGRGTSTLDSAVPSELYLGHHFRKMDMSRAFTLGIQGPDGQRRVTISETSSVDNLYKVTQKAYQLPSATDFVLTKDLQKQIIIENTVNSNVSNYNLRHGDRLFLHYNRNISPTTSNNGNHIHPASNERSKRYYRPEVPGDFRKGRQRKPDDIAVNFDGNHTLERL